MKKSRILGYVLTLAATMVVGGAMGQVKSIENTSNFVELKTAGKGTNQTGATLEDFSYVQKGKSYGYYAMPDAAFHPDYHTAGKLGTLTTGFTWSWDFTDATGFSKPTTQPTAPANFVLIDVATTATTGKILVKEVAPTSGAWAGCSDDTGFDFNLIAFDAPSYDILTGASEGKVFCSGKTDVDVKFSLKSSGTPYFIYDIKYADATIDATGVPAPVTTPSWTDFDVTHNVANKAIKPATKWDFTVPGTPTQGALATDKYSVVMKTATDGATAALSNYELTLRTDLPAGVSTGYKLRVYRIQLLGINGLISRKADFNQVTGTMDAGADFAYYSTANKYHYVYVAAAPTTGPVFHIGNNKAN